MSESNVSTPGSLEFLEFPKIPRLKREVVITEKIDGSNAQIAWVETPLVVAHGDDIAVVGTEQDHRNNPLCLGVFPGRNEGDAAMALYAGSRTRWLDTSSKGDNFGFAKWVLAHADELRALGPGRHFGEWFGQGIQRNYGLTEKRFALFNVGRWTDENPPPACCSVVPILARGEYIDADKVLDDLQRDGSRIVPGFKNPEGVVVFHSASRQLYKLTFKDDGGKWRSDV